ncbi:MAG TPA: cytochrome c3 family protein, partial [Armatimonadota bacterium]|nr:cytochrome c3 family protein [Armatimonadota bacterium]
LISGAHGPGRVKGGAKLNCLSCHGHDQHAVTPSSAVDPLTRESSCKACHVGAVTTLAHSVHGRTGGAADAKKPGCVDCHPANPKLISTDPGQTRKQVEAACVSCHTELNIALKDDVHARPDKVLGDHPTCVSCHGGVGHSIPSPKGLTPRQKVELCAQCHRDDARMARYNKLPDTVPAYEATVHGKGVMRLGRTDEATCTDCHGLHGIVPAHLPSSPTHPRNLPKVCAKCHEGNPREFAFSYASHARFTIEKTVVIPLSRVFSQVLAAGAILALLSLIVLGYRQRLCNIGDVQTANRFMEGYNALSLMSLCIAVTILITVFIMSRAGMPDVRQHLWSAGVLLALSLVAQFLKRVLPPCGPPPGND